MDHQSLAVKSGQYIGILYLDADHMLAFIEFNLHAVLRTQVLNHLIWLCRPLILLFLRQRRLYVYFRANRLFLDPIIVWAVIPGMPQRNAVHPVILDHRTSRIRRHVHLFIIGSCHFFRGLAVQLYVVVRDHEFTGAHFIAAIRIAIHLEVYRIVVPFLHQALAGCHRRIFLVALVIIADLFFNLCLESLYLIRLFIGERDEVYVCFRHMVRPNGHHLLQVIESAIQRIACRCFDFHHLVRGSLGICL